MPATARSVKAARLRPREDLGFFGPESPTWKVWTAPTALIGFQRSVVLEHFDPFLAAAVADSAGIYTDAQRRFDRTLDYFLTVAIADGRTAIEASELLMKVHAKATGIEPLSGEPYSANDPASQLWIHVTGWQGVLLAYERYGPGRLSAEDERRYWRDCVVAAELQTCDPANVPSSREEVREYYAAVRPRLRTSPTATRAMHYLLRTPLGRNRNRLWLGSRLLSPATIATIPSWMRKDGGFDQPVALDRAIVPVARTAVRVASRPKLTQRILDRLVPRTAASYAHWTSGEAPARNETVTPSAVRARREAALKPTPAGDREPVPLTIT